MALSCLVVVTVLALVDASAVSAAATNKPNAVYGSSVGADSLFNLIVGGERREQISFRFRATRSARLQSIVVYLKTGSGYSRGDGGRLRVTVVPDDGTARHAPSESVLARHVIDRPSGNAGRVISFTSPPALVAGRLYHVVFTNIHASPRTNYVSLNGLYTFGDRNGTQPGISRVNWGSSSRPAGRGWSATRNGSVTPIMGLRYGDGHTAGVGYMEVWVREPRIVSGASRVRQIFKVSGRDRSFSRISVRVKRLAGSGPLRFSLLGADGRTIARGRIPAREVAKASTSSHAGSTWVTAKLKRLRQLHAGRQYRLVFTARPNTRYSFHVLRQGSAFRYGRGSFFSDGRAEFRTSGSSGWKRFTGWGRPSSEGDLQFYLH